MYTIAAACAITLFILYIIDMIGGFFSIGKTIIFTKWHLATKACYVIMLGAIVGYLVGWW